MHTVWVDDNYHAMDESCRYELGTFPSLDEAIEASKHIVDEFLLSSYKPGMTADRLYQGYVSYGEDPFIVPADPAHLPFSAREYAKTRCKEICQESNGGTAVGEKTVKPE